MRGPRDAVRQPRGSRTPGCELDYARGGGSSGAVVREGGAATVNASTAALGARESVATLAGSTATLVRQGAISWQLAAGTDCSHGGVVWCLPSGDWLSAGIPGIAIPAIAPAAAPPAGIAHPAAPPTSDSWRARTMESTAAISG